MKYQSFITDLHLNLHPDQINLLEKWYEHSKNVIDFFTIAYYPYHMVDFPGGFKAEEEICPELIKKQWKKISSFLKEKNKDNGFISFIGFEWQGTGEDGDHNIYFKNDDGNLFLPQTYQELVEEYNQQDVMGIPHHLAYSLGNRGKNWNTHNEIFSPLVEVYSHHGSSERDITNLKMNRHIHMGPRIDETSVINGLKQGHHFGIIASGDNHEVPAVVKNGRAGVWAKSYSKEDLWDAFLDRRTFSFTDSKIVIWTETEGYPMGSIIESDKKEIKLKTKVHANSKIERVELYKNGELEEVKIVRSMDRVGSEEDTIKFKFKLECGWGPNITFFPEYTEKKWKGYLETTGEIISVEPVNNSFDNNYESINQHKAYFDMTSHKSKGDRWVRDTAMKNEGFIFEIKTRIDSLITLHIEGYDYQYSVEDLLVGSSLIVFEEEAKELIKNKTDIESFYRSDSWYHNAYKVKLYQGFNSEYYEIEKNFRLEWKIKRVVTLLK